jgi:hypothetical protein
MAMNVVLITLVCVTVYLLLASLIGRRLRSASMSVEEATALFEACAAIEAGKPVPDLAVSALHDGSAPEEAAAKPVDLLPELSHAGMACTT